MILTYKYRLLPNKAQHAALARILEEQRLLYNAALEERNDCYRKTGRTITHYEQTASLTIWRRADETAAAMPLRIQRWTLRRVDEAYRAFFRRLKERKGRAGFPRFRAKGSWSTFGSSQSKGIRFDGNRLRWSGLPGGLRVHLHRPMPDCKILAYTFRRDGRGWWVGIQVRVANAGPRISERPIGLDVGLTHLVTLSTGEVIPNPRHAKRVERDLRRRQRHMARCKRGSTGRAKARARVAQLYGKLANTRSTYLHQVSAGIVGRFDLIAVEKLNVKGLARTVLAGPIHDASWTRLRQLLAYKAERAGAQLIEVNPKNTSQACSGCGVIVKKDLSVRVHECADCGLVLDRDHNAALNILHRAVAGPGAVNVGALAHA